MKSRIHHTLTEGTCLPNRFFLSVRALRKEEVSIVDLGCSYSFAGVIYRVSNLHNFDRKLIYPSLNVPFSHELT